MVNEYANTAISFLTLIICTFHPTASAQKSEQVWASVELTKDLGNGFDFATTINWRQTYPDAEWKRPVVKLTAAYTHKDIRFESGLSTYYTSQKGDPGLFELRPWQGIAATFPNWKRAEMVHFFRFEERFQRENREWSFSPRGRYEVSTRIAITKKSLDDRTLYLYAAVEWLNNFKRPFQERFSNTRSSAIGLGFRFNPTSRVEAIYEADVTDNVRENLTDVDVQILRVRWLVLVSD